MNNMVSKRQLFGEEMAKIRQKGGLSQHNLANKTRSTEKQVDLWESGLSVPTAQEWQRMRQCFPVLMSAGSRYIEMYRAAAAEQLEFAQAAETADADAKAGDDVSAAVKLIIEAMPHLRSMTIEVDDGGEVSVSFKTREVRVVEGSGALKVSVR